MGDVNSLVKALQALLSWQQTRILFVAQFVRALLRSRSCNLEIESNLVVEAMMPLALTTGLCLVARSRSPLLWRGEGAGAEQTLVPRKIPVHTGVGLAASRAAQCRCGQSMQYRKHSRH